MADITQEQMKNFFAVLGWAVLGHFTGSVADAVLFDASANITPFNYILAIMFGGYVYRRGSPMQLVDRQKEWIIGAVLLFTTGIIGASIGLPGSGVLLLSGIYFFYKYRKITA